MAKPCPNDAQIKRRMMIGDDGWDDDDDCDDDVDVDDDDEL